MEEGFVRVRLEEKGFWEVEKWHVINWHWFDSKLISPMDTFSIPVF